MIRDQTCIACIESTKSFFFKFILIGGELLYNIGVVFAIH